MVESLHSYEALPPVFTHATNPEVRSLHTHRASVSVVLLDFIIVNLVESSRLAVQPAKASEVPPVHAPRMQNADAVVSSVEATGRPQTTRLPETRWKSTPSWWAASRKSPAKENRSSECTSWRLMRRLFTHHACKTQPWWCRRSRPLRGSSRMVCRARDGNPLHIDGLQVENHLQNLHTHQACPWCFASR